MGEKLTRGLEEKYLNNFKNKQWFYEFYENYKDKDKLFLGIRNNYINIYYRSMNIARLKGNCINATIAKKYVGEEINKDGKSTSSLECTKSYDEFNRNYTKIKERVDEHIKSEKLIEKDAQANIIYNNNKNWYEGKSNWFCIDMEYTKQRRDQTDGKKAGRFDIIAVNLKEKDYRVALIELKVGDKALGGKCGLKKHAQDWDSFLEQELFRKSDKRKNRDDYLIREITDIIKNKADIDKSFQSHIDNFSEEKFKDTKPEFYFLICSGNSDIESIRNTCKRYTWNAKKCKENHIKVADRKSSIQDLLNYDITEEGSGRLYCKFLFADKNGENINDIIDDESYIRDLVIKK